MRSKLERATTESTAVAPDKDRKDETRKGENAQANASVGVFQPDYEARVAEKKRGAPPMRGRREPD